jgi:ecdysteroid 25-hydroxylase CYP302A1
MEKLHETSRKRREEFGDLVRERLGPVDLLSIYDPSSIESVFKQEGRFPARKSHSALAAYRSKNPHKYNNAGLLAT